MLLALYYHMLIGSMRSVQHTRFVLMYIECATWLLLLQIFDSIGPVRELVVLRDRATQESKGSAFVWYATGSDADKVRLLQQRFDMLLSLHKGLVR
jgi:hypothetical protein